MTVYSVVRVLRCERALQPKGNQLMYYNVELETLSPLKTL
jgi:hypothetical protein